jgi:hypothetical protein
MERYRKLFKENDDAEQQIQIADLADTIVEEAINFINKRIFSLSNQRILPSSPINKLANQELRKKLWDEVGENIKSRNW